MAEEGSQSAQADPIWESLSSEGRELGLSALTSPPARPFRPKTGHINTPVQASVFLLAILAVLVIADKWFLTLGDASNARGFLAVLFGCTTAWVIIVLVLSAINSDLPPERVARGKDLAALLIGLLGTILGYYFGSTNSSADSPNGCRCQAHIANINTDQSGNVLTDPQ